jgi:hypothetical protein
VLIVKLRESRSNFHTSDSADGEARGTYAIEGVQFAAMRAGMQAPFRSAD